MKNFYLDNCLNTYYDDADEITKTQKCFLNETGVYKSVGFAAIC